MNKITRTKNGDLVFETANHKTNDMTEEIRQRYDEDRANYEVINSIVKSAVDPIKAMFKIYVTVSTSVFAFLFIAYVIMNNNIQGKANSNEVLTKLQYYQLEYDEHTSMKEIFVNPSRSIYIFDQINDNIQRDLGFKLTTRGGTK